MAELLLMIYMIPVLIVFSLLLRLVMWIIGKVIQLTWWLVKTYSCWHGKCYFLSL